MPEPSAFEVDMAIKKLKKTQIFRYLSISVELIEAGGRTFRSEIHKLVNSVRRKEELLDDLKEFIIVPFYKKCGKTNCSNYRGLSIFPTTYKILSNILLSRLTPYVEEIIGDHQCRFRHTTSTTDHIF